MGLFLKLMNDQLIAVVAGGASWTDYLFSSPTLHFWFPVELALPYSLLSIHQSSNLLLTNVPDPVWLLS